jgi:hypothetical protein
MTRTQPDSEALSIAYLLTVTEVTDLVDDRVYAESGIDLQAPYLTVIAVSPRADNHHWVGTVLMQIDAYADTRAEARDTCEAAVVALLDIPQGHELGVVTGARDVIGPRQLPDTVGHRKRFEAEVVLTLHPSRAIAS